MVWMGMGDNWGGFTERASERERSAQQKASLLSFTLLLSHR